MAKELTRLDIMQEAALGATHMTRPISIMKFERDNKEVYISPPMLGLPSYSIVAFENGILDAVYSETTIDFGEALDMAYAELIR